MEFWSDVDRLTVAQHEVLHRDEGTVVVSTVGLLQQLREAVEVGREGSGGGSGFGSRPTVDAGAADLLLEVTGEAREAYRAVLGAPPVAMVESLIRRWAAVVNESTLVRVRVREQFPDDVVDEWRRRGVHREAVFETVLELTAASLVKRWVHRIEGFFNPVETREIKAPCPSCGERWVFRVRDGERVQVPALGFVRAGGVISEARCAGCGVRWSRDQFEWLARAVGAEPVPELAGDTP